MNVKLKRIRKENNLTQIEMSRLIGFSLSTYEKIERGHKKPSRNFMERFKEKFPEFKIDDIFFG